VRLASGEPPERWLSPGCATLYYRRDDTIFMAQAEVAE